MSAAAWAAIRIAGPIALQLAEKAIAARGAGSTKKSIVLDVLKRIGESTAQIHKDGDAPKTDELSGFIEALLSQLKDAGTLAEPVPAADNGTYLVIGRIIPIPEVKK